jgi:hypothetical protein
MGKKLEVYAHIAYHEGLYGVLSAYHGREYGML